MYIQTDLVIADLSEARDVAASYCPSIEWEGMSFNGLHNTQLCTLLSLLKTGTTDKAFGYFFERIEILSTPVASGPVIFALQPPEVAQLAAITALDDEELEKLAADWITAEEMVASQDLIVELLRETGDLAETAAVQNRSLLLWMSA